MSASYVSGETDSGGGMVYTRSSGAKGFKRVGRPGLYKIAGRFSVLEGKSTVETFLLTRKLLRDAFHNGEIDYEKAKHDFLALFTEIQWTTYATSLTEGMLGRLTKERKEKERGQIEKG